MKTIQEVSELWKQDKRQFVKSSTIAVYTLHLENYILPKFGNYRMVMEHEVQEFVLESIKRLKPKDSERYAHCLKDGHPLWRQAWLAAIPRVEHKVSNRAD